MLLARAAVAPVIVIPDRDSVWLVAEIEAFNDAHDVTLPGSTGKPLPYLMYPQAEVGGDRLGGIDRHHVAAVDVRGHR